MQPPESFTCRTDNSKAVTNVLNCLSSGSRKDSDCYVEVTVENVMFTVMGKTKTTQSRASLQSALFDDFSIECADKGNIQFVVSLSTILDCLQVFSSLML